MRLLARVHDESRLSEITSLMRSKGIPVFVRSAGPPRGLPKWIVFVCLNQQADDARRLLKDPYHEPKLSVNVEEFEEAAMSSNFGIMAKWGTGLVLVAVALLAGAIFAVSKYGQ